MRDIDELDLELKNAYIDKIIRTLKFYSWKTCDLSIIERLILNIRRGNYDLVISDMIDLKALKVYEMLERNKSHV